MGGLLSGVSFKEPTTVEDCDSTWETDSEPEELRAPGGEGEGGRGEEEDEEDEDPAAAEDEEGRQPQQQPGKPLPAASARPAEHLEPREDAEDEAGEEALEGAEDDDGDEDREEKGGEGRQEAEAASTEQRDDAIEVTAKPKRSFYAARDLYKYRHQYPQNFKDLRYQNDLCNLRFYKNKIPFKPDGVYIEEVLNKWKGDYEKLEHNHTYIQWLFPLREQGLNFYAKELTAYEIEEFKKTKEAIRRFLSAYKMMLEFFGIKLIDKTGNVTRASNWQERFQHLNESQHNYLRITRILKSLGELGYESFKPPLVKFILHEALVEDTIPNIKQSALEYFVYTIRDRRERRKLLRFAQQHYTPSDHFIWGPPKKQKYEGSKPSKKLASPVSLRSSCSSKHKKAKDSKSVSTVCNSSGRPMDEKRAGPVKNMDDHTKKNSGSEAGKQSNDERTGDLECQNTNQEGTTSPSDQKENIFHFKKPKGKNDENLNQDCRHPEAVEKVACDSHHGPTDPLADLQDSADKDKNPLGSNSESKEEMPVLTQTSQ